MTFADKESVVVLAVHEIGVTDLKQQSIKSFGEGDDIMFRFWQKGNISVD